MTAAASRDCACNLHVPRVNWGITQSATHLNCCVRELDGAVVKQCPLHDRPALFTGIDVIQPIPIVLMLPAERLARSTWTGH